jgi:hypothetical protein
MESLNSLNIERRIAALLDDPLTSLVIQADGVDRRVLARDLRKLAGPPEAAKPAKARGSLSRAGFLRPQSDLCGCSA